MRRAPSDTLPRKALTWRLDKPFSVKRIAAAPRMPWGISVDKVPHFRSHAHGLDVRWVQTYADPSPGRTRFYKLLSMVAFIRNRLAPGLVHGFARTGQAG